MLLKSKLKQLALQKTVKIQVKTVFDETILDKNFEIISECMKDLQKQIGSLNQGLKKLEIGIGQHKDQQNQYIKQSMENIQKNGKQIQSNNTIKINDPNQINKISTHKKIPVDDSRIEQIQRKIAYLFANVATKTDLDQLKYSKSPPKTELQYYIPDTNGVNNNLLQRSVTQELLKRMDFIQKQIDFLRRDSNLQTQNYESTQKNRPYQNQYDKIHQQQKSMLKNLERQIQQKLNRAAITVGIKFDDRISRLQEGFQNLIDNVQNHAVESKMQTIIVNQNNDFQEEIKQKKTQIGQKGLGRLMKEQIMKQTTTSQSQRIRRKTLQLKTKNDKSDESKKKQQKLPQINHKSRNTISHKNKQSKQHLAKQIRHKQMNQKLIADLKHQLQIWLKKLLKDHQISPTTSTSATLPSKLEQTLSQFENKLQQLKYLLEKKADQQGVKKYLAFLQSKLSQMYNFLANPQSQDALAARKGWSCLSCAKRIEKYKGKLGQHLNWNNLTTTNYSPPRIGFAQGYNNLSNNKGQSPQPYLQPANESLHSNNGYMQSERRKKKSFAYEGFEQNNNNSNEII